MSDILLDPITHDILDENGNFVGNDLQLVTGIDAIAQHLGQKFRTFFGEWFLNLTTGVPWFEQIQGKGKNPTIIDAILKSVAILTPGVREIVEWQVLVDTNTRAMTLNFKAVVVEGGIVDFSEIIG